MKKDNYGKKTLYGKKITTQTTYTPKKKAKQTGKT